VRDRRQGTDLPRDREAVNGAVQRVSEEPPVDSCRRLRRDVLVETTSVANALDLQRDPRYCEMINRIESRAMRVWTMPARNARRIADVDAARDGLFLFNHFAADDDPTMLDLWEYLAGWYVRKTALKNSVALVPLNRATSDYAIVNWARWDVGLLRHFWHQLSAPSFWRFVTANLDANRAASMPIYMRRV
jgi:hypothetical protein